MGYVTWVHRIWEYIPCLQMLTHNVHKIVACLKNVDRMKGGMTMSIYILYSYFIYYLTG
jgi:hypothetical protein